MSRTMPMSLGRQNGFDVKGRANGKSPCRAWQGARMREASVDQAVIDGHAPSP